MKLQTKLALTAILTTAATILPPALSPADDAKEKGTPEVLSGLQVQTAPDPAPAAQSELTRIDPELVKLLRGHQASPKALLEPPVPVVPEGTKMTEEIKGAIAQINTKLIGPVRAYSSQRVIMSRAIVFTETQYHFAITDTSDSLFPFDVYMRHRNGTWEKIASGACHAGMESLKVALPKTGVMVEPIKHPLFAAALTVWKKAEEKRAG